MEHVDARSLTRDAQAERHRLAVNLLLDGFAAPDVAALVQVHVGTVRRWWTSYRKLGESSLLPHHFYGVHPEKFKKPDQFWLALVIRSSTPSDHGYESSLWTLHIMKCLLFDRRGLNISVPTISRVLLRNRYSPQVPRREAQEQDPEEVQQFLMNEWRDVEAEAAMGAHVVFVDEANFNASHTGGTTWGVVNERPIIKVSGTRPRVSAISGVTWNGELFAETYTGKMDGEAFCYFLLDLMKIFTEKRIIVMMDGLSVHVGKFVKKWVDENTGGRMKLVKFPKYSPMLNPDESIWSVAKQEMKRNPLKKGESWKEKVDEVLSGLAERITMLRRLFLHPALRYLQRAAQEYSIPLLSPSIS